MKIGIIVYSQTGNTYSVAEKLKVSLKESGHDVNIERITVKRDDKSFPPVVTLIKAPAVDEYDCIVFASYVEAFSLCSEMKAYLNQLKSLKKKKIAAFVTKGLPFLWTGGVSAVKKIKNICETKDGTVDKTGIIPWRSKKRNEYIEQLIKDFTTYFKKNC